MRGKLTRSRHEMRTMSSLPDYEMYLAVEQARIQQIEALADIEDITLTLVLQPISANTASAGDIMGGTPLGLKAQPHQCKTGFTFCIRVETLTTDQGFS